MRHLLPIVFSMYLLLHISVSLFGVRLWPLTDYPMFGEAFAEFDELETYRYRIILKNGEKVWAKRSIGHQFGIYKGKDFSKQKDKLEKWESEIKESLIREYSDVDDIKLFQLVKRRAQRVDNSHEFIILDQVEYEFSL